MLANKKLLFKNPGVYEKFGVDIILDENFKLFVIEINPSPMIIGNIAKKTNLFKNLIGNMFNIVYA